MKGGPTGGKGSGGKQGKEKSGGEREEGKQGKGGMAERRSGNSGIAPTTFRVLCEDKLFEAELSDALRARLQSTYFAAALEESPSASMMKFDEEHGAVVLGPL